MTPASSVVTGGIAFSAAACQPVVAWLLNGCPHPIPDSVPYLITAGCLTFGHLIINLVNAWLASRKSTIEVQPVKESP